MEYKKLYKELQPVREMNNFPDFQISFRLESFFFFIFRNFIFTLAFILLIKGDETRVKILLSRTKDKEIKNERIFDEQGFLD